jgi:hypothetical protein
MCVLCRARHCVSHPYEELAIFGVHVDRLAGNNCIQGPLAVSV